jgi:hypothetical protein
VAKSRGEGVHRSTVAALCYREILIFEGAFAPPTVNLASPVCGTKPRLKNEELGDTNSSNQNRFFIEFQ